MRMLSHAACACLALLLAGCGTTAPPYGRAGSGRHEPAPPVVASPGAAPAASPLARTLGYVCEDLTRISIVEGQPAARAILNSGLELSLARQGGLGGVRWGAPPYEFRAAGSEGVWVNQGRSWRCRVG